MKNCSRQINIGDFIRRPTTTTNVRTNTSYVAIAYETAFRDEMRAAMEASLASANEDEIRRQKKEEERIKSIASGVSQRVPTTFALQKSDASSEEENESSWIVVSKKKGVNKK